MAKNLSIFAAVFGRLRILPVALAVGMAGFACTGAQAAGQDPLLGSVDVYAMAPLSGLGLNGYDPVSYFLGAPPKPGKPGIEWIWGGVAWRFSSEANREAFKSDPAAYAPRVGGYDPTALVDGRLADSRPSLYAVSRAGLYLFRDEEARRRFLADAALAGLAEANWPGKRSEILTVSASRP